MNKDHEKYLCDVQSSQNTTIQSEVIFEFIIQDVVLFSLLLNQKAYIADFGQVSFSDYTVDSLKVVCGVQLL